MTRDESLTVVAMVISGWPKAKDMDHDEIDIFARSIQDLDAELVTHTILKMVKDSEFRPSVKELRDRTWIEKRALAPAVPSFPDDEGAPLSLWIKRWMCARMFYKAFGKEKDFRRFREQGDYGDLTQELMPEGAWVEEANSMNDQEVMKRWTAAIRS
jgi:hypothetical protein